MIAFLLFAQMATTTTTTPSSAAKTHVIEIDGHIGLDADLGEQAIQELAIADRRLGGTISFGVVYRTRYFLAPFLDVGYTALSSAGTLVPKYQTGGPSIADERLSVWNLSSGLGFDTWRIRLQGGLGVGFTALRTRLDGDESRSVRFGPMAFFAIGLDLVRAPRFDLALKLRALASGQHLGVQAFSIGLEIRGDLFRF